MWVQRWNPSQSTPARTRTPSISSFLDVDRPNNPNYLGWAIRFSHPGTVIVGHNVVRQGAVADPTSTDDRVIGSRQLLEKMGADSRLESTALQTVGSKAYDGFAIVLVGW